MKQEIKLNDGSMEKVFERFEKDGQLYFNCYICRVGKLPGLLNTSVHARGKRHLKNLTTLFDARRFREKIVEPVESKFHKISILHFINIEISVTSDLKSSQPPASFNRRSDPPHVDAKSLIHNLQTSSYSLENRAYRRKKYELEFDRARSSIKSNYVQYRKNLDSHPRYPKEWEAFWQRRYKEIKKEGKYNPNDYDYKPEWIKYWRKRIDELMEAEIDDKKIEIKKSLGFKSEEDVGMVESKLSRSRSPRSRSPLTYKREKRMRSPSRSPSRRRRTRSRSWSPPRSFRRSKSPEKKYRRSRSRSRSPRRHDGPVEISSEEDGGFKKSKITQERVTFISVCRYLSALESDVGSLAPKVLDLLTKSLQIEKLEPNKSDEVMMTHENLVLLETVAEKLKGILALGMLTTQKENAIRLAIQNISRLIQQTPVSKPMVENKSNGSGMSRSAHMRKRWTELLKSSGRNVSELELDVLVEILEDELQKIKDRKRMIPKSPPREMPRSFSMEESNSNTNYPEENDKPFSKEFEDLSDEDLRLLLSNFSELEIEEQNHMVNFLSYLEKTDPERVKSLKSCVNLDNENDEVVMNDEPEFNVMASTSKSSLTDNLLNFGSSRRR